MITYVGLKVPFKTPTIKYSFLIYNGELLFQPKEHIVRHDDYCAKLGLDSNISSCSTRGLITSDDRVYFYNAHRGQDIEVCRDAISHMSEIAEHMQNYVFDVYLGLPCADGYLFGRYTYGQIYRY